MQIAPTALLSAATPPTDRSMPRSMMTIVIPIAISAVEAVAISRLLRLDIRMLTPSVRIAKPTRSTMKISTTPLRLRAFKNLFLLFFVLTFRSPLTYLTAIANASSQTHCFGSSSAVICPSLNTIKRSATEWVSSNSLEITMTLSPDSAIWRISE